MAVSFNGGGKRSTRRKQLTCRKSLKVSGLSDLQQVNGFLRVLQTLRKVISIKKVTPNLICISIAGIKKT